MKEKEKLSYKERKRLSITKTRELLLENTTMEQWYLMFQAHKKKDDLADCFLQCIVYLRLT